MTVGLQSFIAIPIVSLLCFRMYKMAFKHFLPLVCSLCSIFGLRTICKQKMSLLKDFSLTLILGKCSLYYLCRVKIQLNAGFISLVQFQVYFYLCSKFRLRVNLCISPNLVNRPTEDKLTALCVLNHTRGDDEWSRNDINLRLPFKNDDCALL